MRLSHSMIQRRTSLGPDSTGLAINFFRNTRQPARCAFHATGHARSTTNAFGTPCCTSARVRLTHRPHRSRIPASAVATMSPGCRNSRSGSGTTSAIHSGFTSRIIAASRPLLETGESRSQVHCPTSHSFSHLATNSRAGKDKTHAEVKALLGKPDSAVWKPGSTGPNDRTDWMWRYFNTIADQPGKRDSRTYVAVWFDRHVDQVDHVTFSD